MRVTPTVRRLQPNNDGSSRSASLHEPGFELLFRANNLTDSRKYGSGYASGAVPAYYVLPPRNLFVTVKLGM